MFHDTHVAVVMPAYNVEHLIEQAVISVPRFVDHLIVVDDASSDATSDRLRGIQRRGLICLRHSTNRGVGAAIRTGYTEALKVGAEVIAVMAGDGQMDPRDLSRVLAPVVEKKADYAKGNRFRYAEAWRVMPKGRLIGNIVLSMLTKITSGYWQIFDSQCGYTAISRRALEAINCRLFARYGYPNDILARLRSVGGAVRDVPVRPVYDGQPSGIRLWTVIYPILFVLIGSMARRLWHQRLRPLFFAKARSTSRQLSPSTSDANRHSDHFLPAPPP